MFKNAEEQINTGQLTTDRDFFLLLAKIHTKINCGHSSLWASQKLNQEMHNLGGSFLDMQVKFVKDTLVVSEDFMQIKKGTQIIRIMGNQLNK